MTCIYLPVELCSRELMVRAYLATSLAKNGHKVYVFEHTLFDRLKWPSAGIYIGKNCFRTEVPYSKAYYNEMKKNDIDLWYLDEEGGIYSGNAKDQEEVLTHRLEVNELEKRDKVLVWGEWQKKVFNLKKPYAEVVISGSPNFDIFQEKYKDSLLEWDLNVTGGLKDFILVNTRFSQGNPKRGIDFIFNNKQPHSEKLPKLYMEEVFIAHNRLLLSVIELCLHLAQALPNEKIIIRPHPGESIDIYKNLTKKFKNISVISKGGVESWIRLSKALIHNGCSTAVQAIIAKKNVITYIPENITAVEKNHSAYLPNTIGRVANNPEDVLLSINKPYKNENNIWIDTISEIDSINFISKLVEESELNKNSRLNKTGVLKFFLLERVKDLLRSSIRNIFSSQVNTKFDYKEFSRLSDLVNIANNHYDSNVQCKKITNGCYSIYNKKN